MNEERERFLGLFNEIDGCLVINLDTSKERYERFVEQNSKLIPEGKLHRLSAVDGRKLSTFGKAPWFTERTGERARFWGGTAGLVLSNRNAIRYAKEKGWRNVLLFEDDAYLSATPAQDAFVTECLQQLSGAYMLYFGYSRPLPYGSLVKQQGDCSLWQTEGVAGTYCYLVSEGMYDIMLDTLPREDDGVWEWLSRYRAIDAFYRDFLSAMPEVKTYVVHADIGIHNEGVSDIAATVTRQDPKVKSAQPHNYASLKGCLHRLCSPFRRLKVHLNSMRTHRRAASGGFPGFRKRAK